MTGTRTFAAMTLVLVAAFAGTIGTGLIYTAAADHMWGAVAWGLPLALGGLYWCGRALAQGQRGLRQRRAQGATPHRSGADGRTGALSAARMNNGAPPSPAAASRR